MSRRSLSYHKKSFAENVHFSSVCGDSVGGDGGCGGET